MFPLEYFCYYDYIVTISIDYNACYNIFIMLFYRFTKVLSISGSKLIKYTRCKSFKTYDVVWYILVICNGSIFITFLRVKG